MQMGTFIPFALDSDLGDAGLPARAGLAVAVQDRQAGLPNIHPTPLGVRTRRLIERVCDPAFRELHPHAAVPAELSFPPRTRWLIIMMGGNGQATLQRHGAA
jgi:hypothetical protein